MKLSDLGFKSFPQEFDWALPKGNVRVEQSSKYPGFWSLELDKNFKSDKYSHLLYVDRIPKASLMKFLGNNIDGLMEFDGKPNKTFVNKIKQEVRSLSKPLRFKNMWIHYNFDMPSNATKGILYDIDFAINKDKDSKTLPAKVDKILSSLKKTPFSDMMPSSSVSDCSCFLYNKTKQDKKQGLKIPYISKIDKGLKEEDEDYGYYGAVLMSNTYKGKFKGVGTDATIYYFVLIMGGDTEEDIGNPAVCVEVITPIDKGEDFFLKEVKGAVAKFNPLKFTGKKIYVNKCPKSVTGSAEMKAYSYKGQVITASSKQEAIKKIVADSKKPKIDMKVVNKWMKKNLDVTDKGLGKDHWEIDGEVYYSFKAAKRLAKKVNGYHLPTLKEWHELAEACGCSLRYEEGKFREFNYGKLVKLLKIKHTGYCYETLSGKQNVSHSGSYFWTSESDGCGAYVDSSTTDTGYYDKAEGLSVRLVKD